MLSGSVAFAALGSSFAFIAKTLANINYGKMALGLIVGLMVILVPGILVAIYRLWVRNLSSILEASGWAINSRMRLTVRLAALLAPAVRHPKRFTAAGEDVLRAFAEQLLRPGG